ncbi:hypothetical protein [Blastococcus tunisiensis]|uniref:Uncharacterized protein n=1 Tax=Blastococcus tunisiensis TaxID=1798228 RepID=A0A1I2EM03_9ACTN|nr:hypothetical protein [Blastococcus sp. DSM 46838]SFE93829.1 hypothetical protein SAMN05216574_107111 [Blastococcus sp. DSM 46838]
MRVSKIEAAAVLGILLGVALLGGVMGGIEGAIGGVVGTVAAVGLAGLTTRAWSQHRDHERQTP